MFFVWYHIFWAPSIVFVVVAFCLYKLFMHYLLIVKLFCDIYSVHYIEMHRNVLWNKYILNLESFELV